MAEVFRSDTFDKNLLTLGASLSSGELWQQSNGRVGYYDSAGALSSGQQARFQKYDQVSGPKATGWYAIDGQEVWWDHSANAFVGWPALNDRDFYAGTSKSDWASNAIQMQVNLNEYPHYLIDTARDGFLHVPVAAAGSPYIRQVGGWHKFVLGATNEAEKLDLLSMQGFAPGSNWVADFDILVVDDGASSAVDFNFGVANATHATDADSITESAFFHLDGNDLNLFAESDDGTTEVAATDTTINIALGTMFHCTLDGRDISNVLYYVDGVEVLNGTANLGNLAAATGPLKLLVHLEKSAATDVYDVYVRGRVRTMEQ